MNRIFVKLSTLVLGRFSDGILPVIFISVLM